jgi:P-type Cu+ transporter
MPTFSIGQLSKRAGVAIDTVRYYERNQLLAPAGRLQSGYRRYGDTELKRLRFIRRAKALGFTLADIRELLALSNEPPGTRYTCPMHPEVVRDVPGTCPLCGMALEPMMPSLDDEENPELVDFRRRFWWTLPLSLLVLALGMWGHRFTALPTELRTWLELLLTAPIVLWAAWPFFERWAQSLVNRSPNMWTLIGTGVGAAFGYSVVATVAPGLFPASFHEHGRVAVYFEAAAIIVSLTLLGQIMELTARSSTSAALKSLLGLAPKTARRLNADGTEEDIPLDHVQVGERLRVRPGRKCRWTAPCWRVVRASTNRC